MRNNTMNPPPTFDKKQFEQILRCEVPKEDADYVMSLFQDADEE